VVDTLAISQVALASTSASFGIKTQVEFNEVTGNPATPQVMNIPFVYDLTALGLSPDKLMFEIDLQRMSGTMTAVQVQFIDSNGNYHTGPIVPVTGALTTARVLASDIKSVKLSESLRYSDAARLDAVGIGMQLIVEWIESGMTTKEDLDLLMNFLQVED
jgi:hypothetical protein